MGNKHRKHIKGSIETVLDVHNAVAWPAYFFTFLDLYGGGGGFGLRGLVFFGKKREQQECLRPFRGLTDCVVPFCGGTTPLLYQQRGLNKRATRDDSEKICDCR